MYHAILAAVFLQIFLHKTKLLTIMLEKNMSSFFEQ
jgi:hypothetical protein